MRIHYYKNADDAIKDRETIEKADWVDGFESYNCGIVIFKKSFGGEEITIPFGNFICAVSEESAGKSTPMTEQEFMAWLEAEFAKHPTLAKSNPRSLNELCYVLRMSGKEFAIGWRTVDGFASIPSVQMAFIPSWQLAQKIEIIGYVEEVSQGEIYRHVTVRILGLED